MAPLTATRRPDGTCLTTSPSSPAGTERRLCLNNSRNYIIFGTLTSHKQRGSAEGSSSSAAAVLMFLSCQTRDNPDRFFLFRGDVKIRNSTKENQFRREPFTNHNKPVWPPRKALRNLPQSDGSAKNPDCSGKQQITTGNARAHSHTNREKNCFRDGSSR